MTSDAHPHMHRLINDRPLNRTRLPVGLDDRAAAPLVAAYDGDRDMARARAWATGAHQPVTSVGSGRDALR